MSSLTKFSVLHTIKLILKSLSSSKLFVGSFELGKNNWCNVKNDLRELIENLSAARQQKINVQHQLLLTEQLVATDNEIKATLKVAEHQADVEKNVNAIKAEIETQDQHITQMQKHFKEAENILVSNMSITSLFW